MKIQLHFYLIYDIMVFLIDIQVYKKKSNIFPAKLWLLLKRFRLFFFVNRNCDYGFDYVAVHEI